jgi:hypothetical protein
VGSRSDLLVGMLDVGGSKGLEIGPLASPVVRRGDGDVRYVDILSTQELRGRYQTHPTVEVDDIVEVDYSTHGRTIRDAVGDDAPFDYVLASHVIEHTADLVAWLDDLRSVLRDGGALSLAVPDHRFCFDALRHPTLIADVVDAHLAKAAAPSPGQVFDHYSNAVQWRGLIAWAQEPPVDELQEMFTEDHALERAMAVGSGEGDDVHAWVFTPVSFRRVIEGLQRLGLMSFRLETCSDTIGGEFFALLRATDRDDATSAAPPRAAASERCALDASAAQAELNSLRDEVAALRAERDAMLRSRSWRVTAPLRALIGRGRRLRRATGTSGHAAG